MLESLLLKKSNVSEASESKKPAQGNLSRLYFFTFLVAAA